VELAGVTPGERVLDVGCGPGRLAIAAGAVAGRGMPHNEASPADSRRHVEICLDVAMRHDRDVDMHVDETDDPASRMLEVVADLTLAQGYQGRVTAGHTCALARIVRILGRASPGYVGRGEAGYDGPMTADLSPLRVLLVTLSGFVNRQQQQ